MPEIQPPIQTDELKSYVSEFLQTDIATIDSFVDNYLDECFDILFKPFKIDCLQGFDSSPSVRGFVGRRETMNQNEVNKSKAIILSLLQDFKLPRNILKGKKGVKLSKILKFFEQKDNNNLEIAKIVTQLTQNNILAGNSSNSAGTRITPALLAKQNKILAQTQKEQIKANITKIVVGDILKKLVSENEKQTKELEFIKTVISQMLDEINTSLKKDNPNIKELADNILALINSMGWYSK